MNLFLSFFPPVCPQPTPHEASSTLAPATSNSNKAQAKVPSRGLNHANKILGKSVSLPANTISKRTNQGKYHRTLDSTVYTFTPARQLLIDRDFNLKSNQLHSPRSTASHSNTEFDLVESIKEVLSYETPALQPSQFSFEPTMAAAQHNKQVIISKYRSVHVFVFMLKYSC